MLKKKNWEKCLVCQQIMTLNQIHIIKYTYFKKAFKSDRTFEDQNTLWVLQVQFRNSQIKPNTNNIEKVYFGNKTFIFFSIFGQGNNNLNTFWGSQCLAGMSYVLCPIVLTTFFEIGVCTVATHPYPCGKKSFFFCLNLEMFFFFSREGNRRSTFEVRERTNNKLGHWRIQDSFKEGVQG
jgi:hypothetical protein